MTIENTGNQAFPVSNNQSLADTCLPVEVSDWQASLAGELLSPSTRRAYGSVLKSWIKFAESNGASAMPPDEPTLLAHLKALADNGASISRLRLLAAGLSKAGAYNGFPRCVPPSVGIAISALSAKRSREGFEQRQATGVHDSALSGIAVAARQPRRRGRGKESLDTTAKRAALDEAIVRVMRDGLFRVSECATLLWSAIETNDDGSATITVRRSKTKSTTTAYLSRKTMAALLASRRDGDDRVIPLSASQIAKRFKSACKAAGIETTSHGARVGMAQDLAAHGVALPELMTAGNWKRPGQVAHYIRRQAASDGPVARFYESRN